MPFWSRWRNRGDPSAAPPPADGGGAETVAVRGSTQRTPDPIELDPGFASSFRARGDERAALPRLGPWGGLANTATAVVAASRFPDRMVTPNWSASIAAAHPDEASPLESFASELPSLFSLAGPLGTDEGAGGPFRDTLPVGTPGAFRTQSPRAARPTVPAQRLTQRSPALAFQPSAMQLPARPTAVARRVDPVTGPTSAVPTETRSNLAAEASPSPLGSSSAPASAQVAGLPGAAGEPLPLNLPPAAASQGLDVQRATESPAGGPAPTEPASIAPASPPASTGSTLLGVPDTTPPLQPATPSNLGSPPALSIQRTLADSAADLPLVAPAAPTDAPSSSPQRSPSDAEAEPLPTVSSPTSEASPAVAGLLSTPSTVAPLPIPEGETPALGALQRLPDGSPAPLTLATPPSPTIDGPAPIVSDDAGELRGAGDDRPSSLVARSVDAGTASPSGAPSLIPPEAPAPVAGDAARSSSGLGSSAAAAFGGTAATPLPLANLSSETPALPEPSGSQGPSRSIRRFAIGQPFDPSLPAGPFASQADATSPSSPLATGGSLRRAETAGPAANYADRPRVVARLVGTDAAPTAPIAAGGDDAPFVLHAPAPSSGLPLVAQRSAASSDEFAVEPPAGGPADATPSLFAPPQAAPIMDELSQSPAFAALGGAVPSLTQRTPSGSGSEPPATTAGRSSLFSAGASVTGAGSLPISLPAQAMIRAAAHPVQRSGDQAAGEADSVDSTFGVPSAAGPIPPLPLNTETWISREGDQPGEVSNSPDSGTGSTLPMRNPVAATAPPAAEPAAPQAPGGAEATGTISEVGTGAAAPSAPGAPGADVDKLAEKVWQVVRRKLALERERRRGVP